MQLQGATELELRLYHTCCRFEAEGGCGELQTAVSVALSDASNELQRLRNADWRIGHCATPKMRTHYWFRHMGVIRRIYPESPNLKETMDVEIYHGDGETTILHEPTEEWMTA